LLLAQVYRDSLYKPKLLEELKGKHLVKKNSYGWGDDSLPR